MATITLRWKEYNSEPEIINEDSYWFLKEQLHENNLVILRAKFNFFEEFKWDVSKNRMSLLFITADLDSNSEIVDFGAMIFGIVGIVKLFSFIVSFYSFTEAYFKEKKIFCICK